MSVPFQNQTDAGAQNVHQLAEPENPTACEVLNEEVSSFFTFPAKNLAGESR